MKKLLELAAKAKFYCDVLMTNENSVCIDCGANIGKYTQRMTSKGATVYAFEPNPWAYKRLKNLNLAKVIPIQKCVSTSDQYINLYLHSNHNENNLMNSTGSSVESQKWNVDLQNSIKCESIDIAKFIVSLGKPIDILKIDIEGHEIKVLKHIAKNPEACSLIRSCYVELHDDKFKEFAEETEQLVNYFETFEPFSVNFNWH